MPALNRFEGRRILVLEDDYWIVLDLVRELTENGAEVVGPFGNIDEALAAIEQNTSLDGAILDVNVQGREAFGVADILLSREIPLVFATGYAVSDIPVTYGGIPVFQKPVDVTAITNALLS